MIFDPFHSIYLSKNINGIIESMIARIKVPKVIVIPDTSKKLAIKVEIKAWRKVKITLRKLDLDDSENTTIALKGRIVNKPIKKGSWGNSKTPNWLWTIPPITRIKTQVVQEKRERARNLLKENGGSSFRRNREVKISTTTEGTKNTKTPKTIPWRIDEKTGITIRKASTQPITVVIVSWNKSIDIDGNARNFVNR